MTSPTPRRRRPATPRPAGTSTGVIRLGTRRSALATAQAGRVADGCGATGREVELVEITTYGDTSAASR